jgi:hypothetical protein
VVLHSVRSVFVDTDKVPALESKVGDLVQNRIEADLVYKVSQRLAFFHASIFSILTAGDYLARLDLDHEGDQVGEYRRDHSLQTTDQVDRVFIGRRVRRCGGHDGG